MELDFQTLYELIESEIDNKSVQELAFEKLVNIKDEYGRLKQENEELEEKNKVLKLKIDIINNNNKIVEEMNKDKLCDKLKQLNEALSDKIKLKNENKSLKKELETLRESLQSEIEMLTHNRNEIMKENTRLRKIIKILKDNYPIKFLGYNKYGAKPYEIMFNGYIMGFEKEEYDLLEEEFNKNE